MADDFDAAGQEPFLEIIAQAIDEVPAESWPEP
jgi:hypothetical protein